MNRAFIDRAVANGDVALIELVAPQMEGAIRKARLVAERNERATADEWLRDVTAAQLPAIQVL